MAGICIKYRKAEEVTKLNMYDDSAMWLNINFEKDEEKETLKRKFVDKNFFDGMPKRVFGKEAFKYFKEFYVTLINSLARQKF